ncbi:MAG TPA: HDOD domain-containing protein [Methylibium sp.]|uniref:EAL and HDOD domain-containing protein n=1 Tax=Methylibium sp. TaxID=2067992 RepID=UPI002DBC3EC3|nr:HDOD domain-containing protein [Methylibium sp.]HEU4460768.1 HDOD domain-containing protein [Methylibium sp.]
MLASLDPTPPAAVAGGILGQVALSYAPMIDRKRTVSATRLTVFPLVPGASLDAGALLAELARVWPEGGGLVSLNLLSESLIEDLVLAQPSANLMIEIPAFMASDEAQTEALRRLHAAGGTLIIKGRPLRELPRDLLPCFKHSIVALGEDRRVGEKTPAAQQPRSIGFVQSDVHKLDDMEASFARGAVAVLGWPMRDVIERSGDAAKAAGKGAADLQVMVDLVRQIDAEASVDQLEATLKRDPALAFKLMRYMNSAAFGMTVEISSFRHAIMLLGHQRLKRWVALLLATGSKDPNLKPVMFAAVRRGMLMEELARSLDDPEMRNELFICGVFSLLDRMFNQPFAELLKTVPVAERVSMALVEGNGPYAPYCRLVEAIEGDQLDTIREACDGLLTEPAQINRALLAALAKASQID